MTRKTGGKVVNFQTLSFSLLGYFDCFKYRGLRTLLLMLISRNFMRQATPQPFYGTTGYTCTVGYIHTEIILQECIGLEMTKRDSRLRPVMDYVSFSSFRLGLSIVI